MEIKEVNVLTGEVTVRQGTAEEIAQLQQMAAQTVEAQPNAD